MAATPSSEIINLVTAFGDSLESVPPNLTRSLSDLRELDAVLSGSLASITTKLVRLHTLMVVPGPGTGAGDSATAGVTAYDRLKLLREVTEDARVYRMGGEDKIRVATGTCETIAAQQLSLSIVNTVLYSFLPSHLPPVLPAPNGPEGVPFHYTPHSTIARRQQLDYPQELHPGAGGTARIRGAHGMVLDHREFLRARTGDAGGPLPRHNPPAAGSLQPSHGGAANAHKKRLGGGLVSGTYAEETFIPLPPKAATKEAKPKGSHPNQYTKKRLEAEALAAAAAVGLAPSGATNSGAGGGPGTSRAGSGGQLLQVGGVGSHPLGLSAVDAVREKRRGGAFDPPSRASSVGIEDQPGRVPKRKVDELINANKRRKKAEDSPDPFAGRTTTLAPPMPATPAGIKPPRRSASRSFANEGSVSPALPPLPTPSGVATHDPLAALNADEPAEAEDLTPYCYCSRPSFGEMIGCEGESCAIEWFHLGCVGLQTIPKGSWWCDECNVKRNAKSKSRR